MIILSIMAAVGYLTSCAVYAKYRYIKAARTYENPFSRRQYTIFYTIVGPVVFSVLAVLFILKLPFIISETLSDVILKD